MAKNKETFKAKVDEQEIEFAIIQPTREILRKARMIHSKTFGEALAAKAPLRAVLFNYMREQGMWNDEKEKLRVELIRAMGDDEKKLLAGGIKLSEARDIAIRMRKNRLRFQILMSDSNSLDGFTAEGQADNARFNYLVSACLVYNDTGKVYFENVDQYEEQANTDVAALGATTFARLYYDIDPNAQRNLPENKFLLKYKFVDEQLRLINKDGKLVDDDGNLIDENGRLIDENGNFVDHDGNVIDIDGNLIIDAKPFLDDDGEPIEDIKTE